MKTKIRELQANFDHVKQLINKPIDQCDSVDEFNYKSAHRDLKAACQVRKSELLSNQA